MRIVRNKLEIIYKARRTDWDTQGIYQVLSNTSKKITIRYENQHYNYAIFDDGWLIEADALYCPWPQ